ncbi:MAG: alpha/beta hydrolase [Rhizobiaceae bacterium]|nr:alpha/beta hydrolase [Rhizobiaceae bacterium]
MPLHRIADWNDAYANRDNIPAGERWPQAWIASAAEFRARMAQLGRALLDERYAGGERNRYDLFLPEGKPAGVLVFVHGGYWMAFDQTVWSHLANGAAERGYAVAMPTYTLCPQARVGDITKEIAQAIAAAAGRVAGPLFLAGHSAGGHLVTRMLCADASLPREVSRRIAHVVSISGLHDLRPLIATRMNETLRLDETEAKAESPALLRPRDDVRLTCWVGAAERSEFIRQNALLANVWVGLGASTQRIEEPDRHHFNVIDGLADPAHPLVRALLLE